MKNRLGIKYSINVQTGNIKIFFDIGNSKVDAELAERIIDNINRNVQLFPCKNCEMLMIVNSPTHEICWRCRNKDRSGKRLIEI